MFQLLTQWADKTITTVGVDNAAHVYEEMGLFGSEGEDWFEEDEEEEWVTTTDSDVTAE